jgi:Overcoming lysogenization defect protein-like, TOPRIM domain
LPAVAIPEKIKEQTSMDTIRRERARRLLDGYVRGPAAATQATAIALEKVPAAQAVLLVEGISDQIAIETLAVRLGRDFAAERLVVLPTGGAHAMKRYLKLLGPAGADLRLAGLCDRAEEHLVRRALASAGIGSPETQAEMERLGFAVCVEDLEDEMIRAIGATRFQTLIESEGDLGSFRSLQRQPQWRAEAVAAQLRRFLGSGGSRKLRYAGLLAAAVDLDQLPHPLETLLVRK